MTEDFDDIIYYRKYLRWREFPGVIEPKYHKSVIGVTMEQSHLPRYYHVTMNRTFVKTNYRSVSKDWDDYAKRLR